MFSVLYFLYFEALPFASEALRAASVALSRASQLPLRLSPVPLRRPPLRSYLPLSSYLTRLLPYHYQTNLRINFNKTSQAEATIDHNGFTTVQIRMSVLMEGCSITTEIKMGWVGSSGP